MCVETGGRDEFQGMMQSTFTRADGTQLGTQGEYASSVAPLYSFIRATLDSTVSLAPNLSVRSSLSIWRRG